MSGSLSQWVREEVLRLWERWRSVGEWAAPEATIDDFTLDELAACLAFAEDLGRAASLLRGYLRDEMGKRIGEGKNYRYGDLIYRVGPKRTVRVEDPRALADFLGSDVARVFRLSGDNLRQTELRKVAEERDLALGTVFETFGIRIEESEIPQVQVLPIDRAPKFLQKLDEGQVA